MKKMVGFGDYLVRLNPEGYLRFSQADRMECCYTGAEANVCASLSIMGIETEFVTRVPNNEIAVNAVNELKRLGVGTKYIQYGGDRLGLFYLEKGASQRPSKVIYDRKFTSIATAEPDMFDWEEIFSDAQHFHITGITPALSKNLAECCLQACKTAKRMGITVSCDLNYRKNLWSREDAGRVMKTILSYVDLVIANEEDAEQVLGIKAPDSDVVSGQLSRKGYEAVARQIVEQHGVKAVGITLRRSLSASDNEWSAMLYENGTAWFSRTYPIHLVDRVGGGDSFAAALIYGTMKGLLPEERIEFAAAASCLKQTIERDVNLSTVEEINRLVMGDGSGRVQR